MHFISTTVVLVAALSTLTVAAPASETRDPAAPVDLADVHLADDQETVLTGSSNPGEAAVRDKRTIGPLRQLFPGLSQIVDRKIQQITRVVFRLVGRLVLGGGANANSNNSSSSSGRRKVSITLPTYAPTEDDEDEEEDTEVPINTTSSSSDEIATSLPDTENASASASASASLSAALKTDEMATNNPDSGNSIADSSASSSDSPNEDENQLNGAESKVNEVRVPFSPDASKSAVEGEEGEDQEEEDLKPAASSDNAADGEQEELDNETAADEDEDNRNKRFLPFNVGASAGAGDSGASASAGAGSGGGSGNFLFDIIRLVQKTADSAARVTGKVYRLVAGTDNVGLGFKMPTSYSEVADDTNSSASSIDYSTRVLVAGSGTTQERDEAETAPADGSTSSAGASASAGEAKDDGYSEGVPGPITRLFVIANRGIANLVQDLILRLAQTSERIVNFKARLITSII